MADETEQGLEQGLQQDLQQEYQPNWQQVLQQELSQVKAEAQTRQERIATILKMAVSESVAEVKAGTGEARSIGQRIVAQLWQRVPRSRAAWQQQYETLHVAQRLNERVGSADQALQERYGDRYTMTKQRLAHSLSQRWQQLRDWYQLNRAKTEAQEPDAIEVQVTVVEQSAADMGTTMAQKERQVQERVTAQIKQVIAAIGQ